MPKVTSYRDLTVWQKGMELVHSTYRLTTRFPTAEQFGLVAQLRRAAVSVPSNIAEGFGRQATGEYRHHLSVARGSVLELETQLLICETLGFGDRRLRNALLDQAQQLSRMLATLVSRLR
jgi:four helix bundle protein